MAAALPRNNSNACSTLASMMNQRTLEKGSRFWGLALACFLLLGSCAKKMVHPGQDSLIEADNKAIQYTGRVDFSDPKKPKFWASGVYITARFKGPSCEAVINDEVLGGNNHNYLEIIVDNNTPVRLKLTEKTNTVKIAEGLSDGEHTVTLVKNTESGIGYLEFLGFRCKKLVALPPKPTRKLEFVGNSITCGTGMDLSVFPCNQGQWYDQHNAYMAYGPRVARQLGAQWYLTSVSGIGLIHSCCDMTITMPQVFDKVNQRANAIPWDFSRYEPDAITVCLGQNDGRQDSTKFCGAYVQFIKTIRGHYPNAEIITLTSPMADSTLTPVLKRYLTGVVNQLNSSGDRKVHSYFFSRSYNRGCGGHPDLADHELIANELSAYLKKTLGW